MQRANEFEYRRERTAMHPGGLGLLPSEDRWHGGRGRRTEFGCADRAAIAPASAMPVGNVEKQPRNVGPAPTCAGTFTALARRTPASMAAFPVRRGVAPRHTEDVEVATKLAARSPSVKETEPLSR